MRQRREVLLVALGLLLASVPAVALPTPPAGPFLARGPILIDGDANFTAANGVVGGTGAAGDPYVIAGWAIGSASGTAIKIQNVTRAFVVRDNHLDARVGVHITQSASVGVVKNNQFIVRYQGVLVVSADAHVVDNSFIGAPGAPVGRGVELFASNSRVESNAFLYLQYGIRADRGSPLIACNDIHDDVVVGGVALTLTTNATVRCNTFTQCTQAIIAEATIGTVIDGNVITSCDRSIEVKLSKDANVTNNYVRFGLQAQIFLDIVSGNVTGNTVIDGRASGILAISSPVNITNNNVTGNLQAGIVLQKSSGDVAANVIVRNDVGISLTQGSIPHLQANVMLNNTVGISIPYESRQAIVNMSANVVNGVNIDGTLDASQQVFFYKEANVTIEGQVRDSGFSAGYYGAISAQGGIVLYEVNTAHINATVVAHQNVGVAAVNSFNVNVNGSLLFNNLVGVRAEAYGPIGPQVPNCAIFVKDTNVTIPQDPVATVGIDVRACVAILAGVEVSIVDTGIKVDGSSTVTIANATVTSTRIGLDVQGKPGVTNVTGNVVAGNRIGARFSGTSGIVQNNTFQGNAEVGVRLENGAALDFRGNNVSENGGAGLLDMEVCAGPLSCSSIDGEANVFYANEGDGAKVNGDSSWEGDLALANEEDGFDLGGSVTFRDVVARANRGDGGVVAGAFDVDRSSFDANDGDGLEVVGAGRLRASNFTDNRESGIRMRPVQVYALDLNVSRNFDGILIEGVGGNAGSVDLPPPNLPGLLPFLWEGGSVGASGVGLEIHLSALLANRRDAIRAGGEIVNATHNYFGRVEGPAVNVADEVGAYQNGVSPYTRFIPYYTDPAMTTTGPAPFL